LLIKLTVFKLAKLIMICSWKKSASTRSRW